MSPSSLRRQIGQLLIAGFNGEQLPVELKSIAAEFGLGGVILFARNIAEPEQVAELCGDAARLLPDMPPWVSVDQEGGRVARLKAPFTEWPPMATLGGAATRALAERFARALGAELRAVGISLDYAPVLDIHTNPKNPVIGDRAIAETGRARLARLARRSSARSRRKGLPRAASTFRDMATLAPIRISSCRSSTIRPIGCARSSSRRFGGDRGASRHHHDRACLRAVARRRAAGDPVEADRRRPASRDLDSRA